MKSSIRWCAMCAAFMVTVASAPAFAQQQEEGPFTPGEQAFLVLSSSSSTSSAIMTVGYVFMGMKEERIKREILILQQVVMIDEYMRHNEAGVQMAFAMSSGEELDELARLMGYGEALTQDQRQALRAERVGLLAAFDQGDDEPELAGAFHVYSVFANVLWGRTVVEVIQ